MRNSLLAKVFRPEILYKVERLSHTVAPIGAYPLIRQFCSLNSLTFFDCFRDLDIPTP